MKAPLGLAGLLLLLVMPTPATAGSPKTSVTVDSSVAGVRLPQNLLDASWSSKASKRESSLGISGHSVSGSTTTVVATWTSGSLRVLAGGMIIATDLSDTHDAQAPGLADSSTKLLARFRLGRHSWSRWDVLSSHTYRTIDLPGDKEIVIGLGYVFSDARTAQTFEAQVRLEAVYQDFASVDEHLRIRTP
jgi:hypothetical protein